MVLLSIWCLPNLSELTPMIYNMELTHLGSEASIYSYKAETLRHEKYDP